MVELLKRIKYHLPFIWAIIEVLNGKITWILYGRQISIAVQKTFTEKRNLEYLFRPIKSTDLPQLVDLMHHQADGFDEFFSPHHFDKKTFETLFRNHSFLMLGAFDKEQIVGYFFIRFFANGKAFRGKMVDSNYRGRGIAKHMGLIMTDIAFNAKFRLFATISKENLSSIASSQAVNEIKILKELDDNYIYIEYLKKNNNNAEIYF